MACEVTSLVPPEVQWRNPAGKVVDVSSDRRLSINEDNELTIDPVQQKDEGNWTCEATNPLGSDDLTYTVLVKFGRCPNSPLDFLSLENRGHKQK